jgi:high affinity Mn2+ porin
MLDQDRINFHGQTTFVEQQAYAMFRLPYEGDNSLPGTGEGRVTFDGTLYAGIRLWQGAELWMNPEIDQGFGFGNTHGVLAFRARSPISSARTGGFRSMMRAG